MGGNCSWGFFSSMPEHALTTSLDGAPVQVAIFGDVLEVKNGKKSLYRIASADILFVRGEGVVRLCAMVPPQPRGCVGCKKESFGDRKLLDLRFKGGSGLAERLTAFANLDGVSSSPLRTLVLVNPVAGQGRGRSDWEKRIEPLLSGSGKFFCDVVFTEKAGHATTVAKSKFESHQFDLLISVGGDGLLFEALNGIYQLANWREIISKLTICPLPSGTGNGLAFSTLCLAGEPFTLNCAIRQLVRGRTGRKDLGIVRYVDDFGEDQSVLFSLTLSWGLVADVDVKSEFLRALGNARFALYGFTRVLRKVKYAGVLQYAHAGGSETEVEPGFLTLYASLVPVAGKTVILDPTKRIDSGVFDVFRLRAVDTTRFQLIQTLSELEERRNHEARIPSFVPVKTVSFELVPGPTKQGAGIVVDGEFLTRNAVRVEIIAGATNCLTG